MKAAPLLLLCAAVLVAGAAGRELQQVTGATCGGVAHCNTCSFVRVSGLTTITLCSKCDTGYTPNANQTACWCAPGYQYDTGKNCKVCGKGYYCAGSNKNSIDSATALSCGSNKNTMTNVSRAETECVADPGYGWRDTTDPSSPAAAVLCEVGYYNSGYNRRACNQCPGGLTTTGTGNTTVSGCVAPPGYYYLSGKAVLCAKGTSKTTTANSQCSKCPEGWTTRSPNTTHPLKAGVGANTGDCVLVAAGYSQNGGTMERCAVGTYAAERTKAADDAASGKCTACPDGFTTAALSSVDVNSCVLKPGYGWTGTTGGVPAAAICDIGTYNPGYNRQPCTECGTCTPGSNSGCATGNLIPTMNANGTLQITGATSSASCAVPPGYGSNRTTFGSGSVLAAIVAYECPVNTYGRSNYTFGLVDVECTKCPDNAITNATIVGAYATGKTSPNACVTKAGYGWRDGSVLKCTYGYYSPGYNQEPCLYCGDGYNTTAGGTDGADPTEGADGPEDCVVDFGYQLQANTTGGGVLKYDVKPCPQGSYKGVLGNSSCLVCPRGTTSVIRSAATNISDCNACRPGFGSWTAGDGTRTSSGYACTLCAAGDYNFGFNIANDASNVCLHCSDLPVDANGADLTQSKPGTSDPDQCYPSFVGAVSDATGLSWDYIPMDDSVLTNATAADATACEGACDAKAGCIYWVMDARGAAETPAWGCRIRNVTGAISDADAAAYDTDGALVTNAIPIWFEIKEDQYVAYKGDATDYAKLGVNTLDTTEYTTWEGARVGCAADTACIGIKGNASPPTKYKLFGGKLQTGVSAKVQVIGQAINAQIPAPSNAPITR